MKIIKHSREAHQVIPPPAGTSNATASFSPAVGQLLGIDSNGTLEVSNAFALPAGSLGGSAGEGETETRGLKAGEQFLLHYPYNRGDRSLRLWDPSQPTSTPPSSSPVSPTSTPMRPSLDSTPRPTTANTSPCPASLTP